MTTAPSFPSLVAFPAAYCASARKTAAPVAVEAEAAAAAAEAAVEEEAAAAAAAEAEMAAAAAVEAEMAAAASVLQANTSEKRNQTVVAAAGCRPAVTQGDN